nr:immunoglobulin heavy chain junction region [Macaca mulatta]
CGNGGTAWYGIDYW